MEAWRGVWRVGLAPQFSRRALEALADALRRGDPALARGATTRPPPPLSSTGGVRPVEAACPVAYCGWRGEGLETVHQAHHFFALVCARSDTLLGEPRAWQHFTDWWDDTPRAAARPLLLEEVERALAARGGARGPEPP